jgi:hypothetical protein
MGPYYNIIVIDIFSHRPVSPRSKIRANCMGPVQWCIPICIFVHIWEVTNCVTL